MKTEKISLVIGSDGLIGRHLADHLITKSETVIRTSRKSEALTNEMVFLDLSHDISNWVLPCHASTAYICAAETKLDKCRKQPVQTMAVNVHNTVALAEKLAADGTFVVFLSTNRVYDGSVPYCGADNTLCPATEYGRQKAEAENGLLRLGDKAAVVRLTKIAETDMPLFRSWIEALDRGEVIHPFTDMVISPVPLSFAVDVLQLVAELRLPGIMQVSGNKDITYAETACRIAQRMGADPALVQPVMSGDSGLYFEDVPAHSTLDTTRLKSDTGIEPPDVLSTIDRMIDVLTADLSGKREMIYE